MCELAPGSPWNTIFFARLLGFPSTGSSPRSAHRRPQQFQVLGRVDLGGRAIDDRHVDAHAGFERAQLLELLAALERRGRQRDEAGERVAAERIEPEMMVERTLAPGRGGAGEIERTQPIDCNPRADDLDEIRI